MTVPESRYLHPIFAQLPLATQEGLCRYIENRLRDRTRTLVTETVQSEVQLMRTQILAESRSIAREEANTVLRDQVRSVLGSLTDRESRIIALRFGLDDGRQRTLEEVGREFGVTRERIRQIEAKALRKLRHPSRSKRLKDYYTK